MLRCCIILLLAVSIFVGPSSFAADVGNGNACDRAGESSMFQGQYLICTGGIWTAQAPQTISAGLNTTACTTAKIGLLRVYNVPVVGNNLQFCDGTTWKTISVL